MNDQELVLDAIKKLKLIIAEYLKAGSSKDGRKTLEILILLLQDQALADAMTQLELQEALRNAGGTAH